ncbi:sugar phosphate isomerase/epimerase [Candidatus Woesearchaeota archaeon]|nr:sugar phosphate isomerase/epimerase [Candidatus Woesearchaeota archaeon]
MSKLPNPIGIMQGRLSPPRGKMIQWFPFDTWKLEFDLAREAGIDCIEWIYEVPNEDKNPVKSDEGISHIQKKIKETGVQVISICADYYMKILLIQENGDINKDAVEHLRWLIGRAKMLKIKYIVLPFVDASSLKTKKQQASLLNVLNAVLNDTEKAEIEIHLETDLEPYAMKHIFEKIKHPLVKFNYDTGNAAALGHNPSKELVILKEWIGSVHIKDRIFNGKTVPLGQGSVDFTTCFKLIKAAKYTRPFILQAARDDSIDTMAYAKNNKKFVLKYCNYN